MPQLLPLNFKSWIEENRHLLRPPVGNRQVWANREFMVTVVGGPNARADFHINTGEEFFYQLEGDMNLRVLQDGKPQDLPIRAGDIFLLPPNIPHSPQRPAGSVGLVIEHIRAPGVKDGFLWICDRCHAKLHDEYLHVDDIVTQLPPVFDRFYSNPELTQCRQCGHRHERKVVNG